MVLFAVDPDRWVGIGVKKDSEAESELVRKRIGMGYRFLHSCRGCWGGRVDTEGKPVSDGGGQGKGPWVVMGADEAASPAVFRREV